MKHYKVQTIRNIGFIIPHYNTLFNQTFSFWQFKQLTFPAGTLSSFSSVTALLLCFATTIHPEVQIWLTWPLTNHSASFSKKAELRCKERRGIIIWPIGDQSIHDWHLHQQYRANQSEHKAGFKWNIFSWELKGVTDDSTCSRRHCYHTVQIVFLLLTKGQYIK